jgi:hypothetical protein
MNGSRQVVGTVATGNGLAGAKRPKTIKVAPVTRAVRAALAVSAAAFALAGSGVAFAGDCTAPVGNVVHCNGDFTDTIHFAVEDLTLVVGDESPSTIVPADGSPGILADWAGNIGLTNYADITTYAADGIDAVGSGDISVDNSGSIDASGLGQVIGIYAYSDGGDVTVVNAAAISAYSYAGLADGIFASGVNVDISNGADGSIDASGFDWAAGIEAQGSDITNVTNDGTISAYAYAAGGYAFGIYATGADVTVANGGTIDAQGYYANGIYVQTAGDAAVDNGGTITTGGLYTSLYATGIHAASSGLDSAVSVENGGDISVQGYAGATGIEALATGAGSSASASNSGDVYVGTYYKYAAGSTGIVASADGDASVDNSGGLEVVAAGVAYGAMALSFNGDASATNSGDIAVSNTAILYYGATGIVSSSQNGSAFADNSGSIDVSTKYIGIGIDASGLGGVTASNSGDISVDAWRAFGIRAIAGAGDIDVDNSGSINATYSQSYSPGRAWGIYALTHAGDITLTNSGDITTDVSDRSSGMYGVSYEGDVAVSNTGYIDASSYAGKATGIFALAYDGDIAVDNAGGIDAYSAYGLAYGIVGSGASVHVSNEGDIQAVGYAAAAGINVYGDDLVAVDNGGSITAVAYGDTRGISAASGDGQVMVGNTGEILVGSLYLDAIGIYAYSQGDVVVSNDGSVLAQSLSGLADGIFASGANVDVSNGANGDITAAGVDWAAGIEAQGSDSVAVANDGSIAVQTYGVGEAFGIYASGGADGATVDNSGTIQVRGYDSATGIYATAGGDIDISNAGYVLAGYVEDVGGNTYASTYASGILALSGTDGAAITIDNTGLAYAASFSGSSGIEARSLGVGGSVDISSGGDVIAVALATGGSATGIAGSAEGNSTIDNSGSVYAYSGGMAYGAVGLSFNGDASVTNSGDIDAVNNAFRYYSAYGIVSGSQNGSASADNSGNIHVYSPYIGVGMEVGGLAGATASNEGDIAADAWVSYGIRAASGQGDVSIDNTGSIAAYYSGAYFGYTFGVHAKTVAGDIAIDNGGDISSAGGLQSMGIYATTSTGDIAIDNGGSVESNGYVGLTAGIFATNTGGDVSVDSSGSLQASSYYGTSVGAFARATAGTASITISGDVDSSATYGTAYGVLVRGMYAGAENNSGDIAATGYTAAYGVYVDGGAYATLHNSGDISATTGDGLAIGAVASGYYGATITNSGNITASADAAGTAIGVLAQAYGDVLVDNFGDISATHPDQAIAVALSSYAGTATLKNSGTISTDTSVDGSIAVLGSNGANEIHNTGDIQGAIVTFGGDDLFANGQGGTWLVGNGTTDFGGGDDAIVNGAGGTIHLADGGIYLGSSGAAGNSFENAGTILTSGYGLIDMGTGPMGLVPSLNPLPLVNNGIIDFVDGSPNDMLVIVGDLGGDGAINLDVSQLNGTSDLLYVDGSVVDGTTQALNLFIDGVPTAVQGEAAPSVVVTGNVAANAFVGGQVLNFDPSNFLDLDVAVTTASSGGLNVVSTSVVAAGLNDTGVLAASVAAGAHSLVNSSIGTLAQRIGMAPAKVDGQDGLSPWIRVFTDKGNVDPHASGFGSGSDFGFEQENRGREFGMNFAFGNGLSLGIMAGNADGTQDLTGAVGNDRLKLHSSGVYATWMAPRFYVDASWRWMDFDARLLSAAGEQDTSGNATAFNLEAGYMAWTVGGVNVVPQAQYTRSKIDDIGVVQGSLTGLAADGGVSERGRIGVAFNRSFAASGGVTWTPYGAVSALREFDGASRYTVADTFTGGTDTEGTSSLVELGIGAQKGGLSGSAGVNWTDGGALDSFVGGQLVLRYTW